MGLWVDLWVRTAAFGFIALGAGLSGFATTTMAAESGAAGDSPLAYCWKQASSRSELAPCLKKLLGEAGDLLNTRRLEVERESVELDRVTDYRSKNVERTRASSEHWRAYRDAECGRQAEAMSPGTGSGDVYLACRITLTNDRVMQLGMP